MTVAIILIRVILVLFSKDSRCQDCVSTVHSFGERVSANFLIVHHGNHCFNGPLLEDPFMKIFGNRNYNIFEETFIAFYKKYFIRKN